MIIRWPLPERRQIMISNVAPGEVFCFIGKGWQGNYLSDSPLLRLEGSPGYHFASVEDGSVGRTDQDREVELVPGFYQVTEGSE